jgi:hypothetical protein
MRGDGHLSGQVRLRPKLQVGDSIITIAARFCDLCPWRVVVQFGVAHRNPTRERGQKTLPRSRFLKLRYSLTSPRSGEVGRGSGRVGPSPGLRARLSQRESDARSFAFPSIFSARNTVHEPKCATSKLTLRVSLGSPPILGFSARNHYPVTPHPISMRLSRFWEEDRRKNAYNEIPHSADPSIEPRSTESCELLF